jgi:hypothetical protein
MSTESGVRFTVEEVRFWAVMELTTILNQCYPQPGFVYSKPRFRADKKAIEVPVRPRKGSAWRTTGLII